MPRDLAVSENLNEEAVRKWEPLAPSEVPSVGA